MHSKVHSFFILLLTLLSFQAVNGQMLSSQEKKKIKTQLKIYLKNPGVFKKEQELMTNELAAQNKALITMKERADNAEATLKRLQDETSKFREEIALKDQIIKDLNSKLNASNSYCQAGEYKVQIGKFDKFSMESYLQRGKCINFEEQNGVKVYTIDGFNDPKEAFNMAQQLRRLGLKGAFVTRFKNNKRVDYDHVVETGEKPFYENITEPAPKPTSKPAKITYSPPPKKELPKIQYVTSGQKPNESQEGFGHSNVKPDKKIINKIEFEDEEDVTEDEGAELNPIEKKPIRLDGKTTESGDIEIKQPTKPAPKNNDIKMTLPTTKPAKEENFEDYEEVKEIPEN